MGEIRLNGISYTSLQSGNTGIVELSLAEYEALSEDEKNNGTMYLIPDGSQGIVNDLLDKTVTSFTPKNCDPLAAHNGCYYKKIGCLCIVYVAVTNLVANTQTEIYILPEGVRPNGTYSQKCSNGKNELGIASITVTGEGQVYVTSNDSIHALASICYIVK